MLVGGKPTGLDKEVKVEGRLRNLTPKRVRANIFSTTMKNNRLLVLALTICGGCLSGFVTVQGQADPSKGKQAGDATSAQLRMTIEVTGGETNRPIENASVYVKTVEEHGIKKNKTTELNVKTNHSGVAHIPDAPTGRVLIQVVAEGWKSYGRWQDVTDLKEVIKIHLDRPPKWY